MSDKNTPIVMTDKPLTKQVVCAFPGCGQQLIVTTFLQPTKAKCPAHGGRVIGAATGTVSSVGGPSAQTTNTAIQATVNPALVAVECPLCRLPMKILRVSLIGHIEYGCADSWCDTYVKIAPNWSHAIIRDKQVPEKLMAVIEALNLEAVIALKEKLNASNLGGNRASDA